jgi:hypothetical protein
VLAAQKFGAHVGDTWAHGQLFEHLRRL